MRVSCESRRDLRTTRALRPVSLRQMPAESASDPSYIDGSRGLANGSRARRGSPSASTGLSAGGSCAICGLGEDAIRHRSASRRPPTQLYPGVYAVGHAGSSRREGRWMAAVLASGTRRRAQPPAAAALWMIRRTPRKRSRRHRCPSKSRSVGFVPQPLLAPPRGRAHRSRRGSRSPPSPARSSTSPRPRAPTPSRTCCASPNTASSPTASRSPTSSSATPANEAPAGSPRSGTPEGRARGRKRSPLEERFAPFLRLHHLPLPRFNDWIVLGD